VEKVFVAGHPMAYRRSGRGEPVLLVHGFATHSFLWRDVIPALATRYDVIAVDLLGCGASAVLPTIPCGLKDHAENLAELIQWLGIRPVHFVGHEIGGGIGQLMAVRHPRTLRSLTLVNSVAADLWPVWPVTALRTPVLRQVVMAAIDSGLMQRMVRRGLHHGERLTPELMSQFLSPLQTLLGRRAVGRAARSLDRADLVAIAGELPKLTLPRAVIWGMADPWYSTAVLDRLVGQLPGCSVHRLETAGHFVPLDEPERLAAILLEALDAVPRSAPPAA
jgi:pimeloyl-ACP methyl ester carboxylesterase